MRVIILYTALNNKHAVVAAINGMPSFFKSKRPCCFLYVCIFFPALLYLRRSLACKSLQLQVASTAL